MYIDIVGKCLVVNETSGEICDLDYKERGWSGRCANQFLAMIKTAEGKTTYKLQGNFTEYVECVDLHTDDSTILWNARPKP